MLKEKKVLILCIVLISTVFSFLYSKKLVVILSFSFHLSKSVVITGILQLIYVISQIVPKALDKKIELRLKRVKQEKQKSIFKLNKF